MKTMFLPLLALALADPALALAQDRQQAAAAYKQMCVQAAAMPKPYGEYDLKGNAKLDAYCGCFGEQFAVQAMKTDPKAKPPSPELASQRELAMRNSCRQKMGLPLAK
ncbi:MAG: hypothetical protein ACXWC4_12920 [Telluria sp.]